MMDLLLKRFLFNDKRPIDSTLYPVMEIIAVFVVGMAFILLFISPNVEDMIFNQMIIWFANILMLSLVFVSAKLRGETLDDFGLSFNRMTLLSATKAFFLSIGVFLVALFAFVLGSIVMANIVGIPESSDMSGYAYLKDNLGMLLLTLAGVLIVSSFGEEVIYRAFLINRFGQLFDNNRRVKLISVLLSATIFGFAHYSWGAMGIVQTGFMGFALGFCYVYLKKRLWILIIAHAYMDSILMVQLYLSSNS